MRYAMRLREADNVVEATLANNKTPFPPRGWTEITKAMYDDLNATDGHALPDGGPPRYRAEDLGNGMQLVEQTDTRPFFRLGTPTAARDVKDGGTVSVTVERLVGGAGSEVDTSYVAKTEMKVGGFSMGVEFVDGAGTISVPVFAELTMTIASTKAYRIEAAKSLEVTRGSP